MTPQGAKRRERPSEPGKEEKPDSGRLTGLTAAAHQRSAPPGLLLRNVSKTSEPSSRDRAAPTAHLPSAPGHRRARAGSAQTRPRPAHRTHGTHSPGCSRGCSQLRLPLRSLAEAQGQRAKGSRALEGRGHRQAGRGTLQGTIRPQFALSIGFEAEDIMRRTRKFLEALICFTILGLKCGGHVDG